MFIGHMNGKLNVAYNCIDKHVMAGQGDQTAIIWEGDEPGTNKYISYLQLQQEVSRVANIMKQAGVKKRDVVTIYMPMIPICLRYARLLSNRGCAFNRIRRL